MLAISLHRNKFLYRQFHTSSPRRIHPLIWVLLKPALKGVAWVAGRTTRKWYRQLPEGKRSLFFDHLTRHKFKYLGTIGTIAAAGGIHYYTHLETEQLTGRRRYIMLDQKQLEFLCDLEKENVATNFGNKFLSENSKETQIVAKVARHLLLSNADLPVIKDLKWTIRVIDTEIKNAFVLPTGDIYVTLGMLKTITNVDQLAVILAHELSHAILNHTAEKLSYSRIIDLIGIFGAFIIWSIFPTVLTSYVVNYIFEKYMNITTTLPYSRFLEQEADVIGLKIAARACYDVREAVGFWQADHQDERFAIPEFLSTHPASIQRAKNLADILPQALEIRRKCNCYPLLESKKTGQYNIAPDQSHTIIEPLDKHVSQVHHIPIAETAD